MAAPLSGQRGGWDERFVPDEMRGQLIEVEHVARYRWAASLAAGRRVLDAGCGTGYGAAIMAAQGASEVAGVDIAGAVLDAIRPDMPDAVTLSTADIHDLPFPDSSFDLAVCFEVIEHVSEQAGVLDELSRVLAPGGVLAISSPNRDVYPPGNPHHLRELTPDELERELRQRFGHVTLWRQQPYLASVIFRDEAFVARTEEPIPGLPVLKLAAAEVGEEMYTLALASDEKLPGVRELSVLGNDLELRRLFAVPDRQRETIREQQGQIDELERRLVEAGEAQARLVDAENALAALPDLELRLQAATADLEQANERFRAVLRTRSWRLTKPLRDAKAAILPRSRRY